MANNMSLFAEANAVFGLGGGGYVGTQIQGGMNMNFGR